MGLELIRFEPYFGGEIDESRTVAAQPHHLSSTHYIHKAIDHISTTILITALRCKHRMLDVHTYVLASLV